jgi:hypothetical protein
MKACFETKSRKSANNWVSDNNDHYYQPSFIPAGLYDAVDGYRLADFRVYPSGR